MASFYILLAIFLWSSLGVIVRLSGIEVHVLIFYSMVVSMIAQGTFLSQRRFRRQIPGIKTLKYALILGILSLVNTFTYFYAFQNTTISNAVLTHYTAPVIVALIAPFLLKEKISQRIIIVMVMASAGLWIMLDGFSLKESEAAGIAAGLFSGFAYAVLIIFLRMHAQKFHPLVLAFFTNLTIALMLAPLIRGIPYDALWSCLFIGIVHSTIAPMLYYRGLQSVTANRAAVLGYIEPVFAIAFSAMLLNEIPGIHSIIGGVLVIYSGYLTLKS